MEVLEGILQDLKTLCEVEEMGVSIVETHGVMGIIIVDSNNHMSIEEVSLLVSVLLVRGVLEGRWKDTSNRDEERKEIKH